MNAFSQVECPLGRSRLQIASSLGLLLCMLVLIASSGLSAAATALLSAALCVHTGYGIALHGVLCLPASPMLLSVWQDSNGFEWQVTRRDGRQYTLRPGSPRVHHWWTRLPSRGLQADVHLLPDNCPADAFRRIRVILNHQSEACALERS